MEKFVGEEDADLSEYNEDQFIIGTMLWSFSRLNSFWSGCKYEWYKHYIECEPSKQGFYGAGGGYAHKILEMYAKGELSVFELSQYFEDHFAEEVPYDAPPNKYKDLKSEYYQKILEYFDNIDLPLDQYEVVGVEKEVRFNIGDYPFIGFIDLLLRDPVDGKLILCDHKSSTIKKRKNGSISKTDEKHFLEFKRQQYLYSQAVMEEFGEGSVKALWWNMFKDRDWIKIPFDRGEYQEAHDWALDTIHTIENETEWLPSPEFFYCNWMCSISDVCPYKGEK